MSIALAYVVATLLSTAYLWAIAKWTGLAVPIVDLLVIAGLCSGLAMLPSLGWALAILIMSLLILRTTDAETWPDAVVMLVGSGVIWLSVKLIFTGWMQRGRQLSLVPVGTGEPVGHRPRLADGHGIQRAPRVRAA